MSRVRTIRETNLARLSTFALVILLYAIYVLGTLLEFGFGVQPIEPMPTASLAPRGSLSSGSPSFAGST